MATFYVNSGAGGTNAGTSWTNAYTAFGSAITAATTAGDVILVHYTHQEELAADTIYTLAADIFVVSVNKDSSDEPTAMGTGGWIGNSTTNRSITFAGVDRAAYFFGVTLRTAGSTADMINLSDSVGQSMTYQDCYMWAGNTNSGSHITLTDTTLAFARFINCTFRFGNTSQQFRHYGEVIIEGGAISSDGSTPATLIRDVADSCRYFFSGFDMSLVTGTLVPSMNAVVPVYLERCKLGAGVTVLASQTGNPTEASGQVYMFDCHSGDTHGMFGYYNALGQVTSDTGIYFTAGAAQQSWKIVTTSYATRMTPFITPSIDLYNTGTSAITPYLEILRDGSTTAFTDQEVWAEFSAKTTSGSVLATSSRDRDSMREYALGSSSTAQANGAGLGSWTGESGTAWSGKIDSGSSITPAEVGALRGRICVAATSTTLYVDPQIRT